MNVLKWTVLVSVEVDYIYSCRWPVFSRLPRIWLFSFFLPSNTCMQGLGRLRAALMHYSNLMRQNCNGRYSGPAHELQINVNSIPGPRPRVSEWPITRKSFWNASFYSEAHFRNCGPPSTSVSVADDKAIRLLTSARFGLQVRNGPDTGRTLNWWAKNKCSV